MISMLATALVVALIAGIFLRSAAHAILLMGLVIGAFLLSCYAFDVSPRVLLHDTVGMAHDVEHEARREYRAHRNQIKELL